MEQLRLFTPPEPKGRRGQRGAELVEFALVFPVLMLFIIAALSLLWLGFMKVAAAQTAKEAARYASVPIACQGDVGAPLVEVPTSITVPNTLPDGTPIPQPPDLATIITVPETTTTSIALPDTTTTSIAFPDRAVVSPPMKLASATRQIGPVTTLQTTLTTLQTTLTTLLTTTTTAPTTTTTAAPTTTTSITLPPTTTTSITLPSTTTTTLDPHRLCTSNYRTYPDTQTVATREDKRVPLSLWHLGSSNFDIVYTYNDPSCPSGEHRERDPNKPAAACDTAYPNDPPSNSTVNVKVTQELTGPFSFFASIFNGSNKLTANSGGETRGE